MKNIYTTLIILVLKLGILPLQAFAQPANDHCDNAIPIFCGDALSGTTYNSTIDTADFCTVPITTGGVWYKFTGDGNLITVATCPNSTYDGQLSVYTGTCGALNCIGGNDDFCGPGGGSSVTFCSTAGIDYYILIHGWNTSTGYFVLTLTCNQTFNPGTINAASAVCSGGSTELVFNGNTIGATIQWQQSLISGGPYADIPGADSSICFTAPITQTNYFILNATCGSATGTTAELQVAFATYAYPGYLSGGYTTICSGTSIELAYINTYYNYPGILLQWQQSLTSGGPYTDIPGATNDTLITPPATDTTYYVMKETCSGVSDISSEDPVFVATGIDPVSISSYPGFPICPGSTAYLYSFAGYNSGISYQWQYSLASGGPYLNIPGANSETFTTPPLNQDTYYLLSASCGSSTTFSNEHAITMGVEAGYIFTNHILVCSGSSTIIRRDLYSNYSASADLQWQQSYASGGPYTDIPGETNPTLNTPPITQTTYFVLKSSCGGFSAISNEVMIDLGVESAYISGDVNLICPGNTAVIGHPYSEISPGANLQWQQSTVSGGPYTDIPGATGDTLYSPPVNQTTYFVLQTSCGASTAVSNEVMVDVYPSISAGYIINYSTPFAICSGGTTTLAYNSGNPQETDIQWQQSLVSGGPYTDIPGAHDRFYTTSPLSQTTFFVVRVSCGNLAATSAEHTVVVGVDVGPIYSNLNAVCPGGSVVLYSTSFSTGVSLQWQQSSISGGPYTDIPGETGISLNSPPIAAETFFVLKGSCGGNSSTSAELQIAMPTAVDAGAIANYTGSPVCSGVSVELVAQFGGYGGNPVGTTFQWQQSSVSGGPFTDIPGETSTSYVSPPITQDTYYILKTMCGSVTGLTSEILVPLATSVYAGTLYNYSGTPVVCSGNGVSLYQYGNTVGSTIEWQQSSISGGPYVDIPYEYSGFYYTPALTQSTYYVVKATCGALESITPEVAVTVGVSAGTINNNYGPSQMCRGGISTLSQYCCPTGSSPGADVQWQQSLISGGPYSDIPGETGLSYTTPALTQTTYYILKATCNGLSAVSNEIAINIGANAGTIYGSTVLCGQGIAHTYSTGYFTGTTFQWLQSATSGGPYTEIPGATGIDYYSGNLTQDMYYELKVSCDDGSSDTSNEVAVIVLSQPSNDNICNAQVLAFGTLTPFNNSCATIETGEPAPGIGTGTSGYDFCMSQNGWCGSDSLIQNTVWFKFVTPSSRAVKIHCSFDSDPNYYANNTQLALWAAPHGCSRPMTLVAANDDRDNTTGDYSSEILPVYCLKPHNTYYIQVDGYYGQKGSGSIILEDVPEQKVLVCHQIGNRYKTLSICSCNLPAHLAHGDVEGACPPSNTRNQILEENDNTGIYVEAYPNPFSDKTTLEIGIDKACDKVSMEIFDLTGQKIMTLFEGKFEENEVKQVEFAPPAQTSNIYIYVLKTDLGVKFGRLNLIK